MYKAIQRPRRIGIHSKFCVVRDWTTCTVSYITAQHEDYERGSSETLRVQRDANRMFQFRQSTAQTLAKVKDWQRIPNYVCSRAKYPNLCVSQVPKATKTRRVPKRRLLKDSKEIRYGQRRDLVPSDIESIDSADRIYSVFLLLEASSQTSARWPFWTNASSTISSLRWLRVSISKSRKDLMDLTSVAPAFMLSRTFFSLEYVRVSIA